MQRESLPDFAHLDRNAERLKRRHAFSWNPTGDDQLEIAQVNADIIGKAMRCHPAAYVHAERTEFFVPRPPLNPRAMPSLDAFCRDPEIGCRANHHFLELLDVPADVAALFGQIKNGVGDDLAGAVVGNVAAAIRTVQFDVPLFKHTSRCAQVFDLSVSPQGDDMRVLTKKQDVGNRSRLASFDKLTLQCTGRTIRDQAQVNYPADFFVAIQLESPLPPAALKVDCQPADGIERIAHRFPYSWMRVYRGGHIIERR